MGQDIQSIFTEFLRYLWIDSALLPLANKTMTIKHIMSGYAVDLLTFRHYYYVSIVIYYMISTEITV